MTTTAALLACVLLLGGSIAPQKPDHEPADPTPTRASRAALIVDTSSIDTTVVLLPPQPTCDRLDAWAARVSHLLRQTDRTDDTIIVRFEEKQHRAIALELKRRIANILAG
jgi:hypothetical protein